jgi:hypothetical protein
LWQLVVGSRVVLFDHVIARDLGSCNCIRIEIDWWLFILCT